MGNRSTSTPLCRRRGRDAGGLGDDSQREIGQQGLDHLAVPRLVELRILSDLVVGDLGDSLRSVGCGPGTLGIGRMRRQGARPLGEALGGNTSCAGQG